MAMDNALYSKEKFRNKDANYRIGLVISDGMWYSLPKWRKLARVTEEEINAWIEEHLASGDLIQAENGAKSYRFGLHAIKKWYLENDEVLGTQLVDFLFPPRIWGGLTEVEGFLSAPLREIAIVTFEAAPHVAQEVIEKLRGIARVREVSPGKYKTYSLDPSYVKDIVTKVFNEHSSNDVGRNYGRMVSKRREMVDFPREFSDGLVMFYKNFGKSLVKKRMDTISIFLPDPDEQEAQIIIWVIEAIEKCDEKNPVPFSGYLDIALTHWPLDLPNTHLGKELAEFQRQRSRALKSLKKRTGKAEFSTGEVSGEMGFTKDNFIDLEEKHKVWISSKTATTLTWEENSEEKSSTGQVTDIHRPGVTAPTDVALANRLSYAVVLTALSTELWEDAFKIISQIDASDINISKIREVSDSFIQSLGSEMGVSEGM